MKALSVRAPWWWAILHGKPIENRDWYTNQRGRIYLHASKWWQAGDVAWDQGEIDYMAQQDGITIPHLELKSMRACGGHVVGSVEIMDCVNKHPSAFFVGEWGFVLRNPITFKRPIPFKGALGFFEVPDGIEGGQ